MKKFIYAYPLSLTIGLFGCTEPPNDTSAASIEPIPENKPTTEGNFVSKLPDSAPTLKVATTGNMPPFSFRDEYGNFQGIDIDALRAIGEDQGFKVDFFKEDWSDLFSSVVYGNRDMAASGISYSEARDEEYGLSNSYFFNPSAIMYRDTSLKIQNLEDLEGLRVGVLDNTKQFMQVQELDIASEVVVTTTTFLLFEDLMQDNVDAIVQDLPLLQYTANNHPSQRLTIATYEDKHDPLAQQVILMAKDDTTLIAKVNAGIESLKSTGEMAVIKGKWLSATTPAAVNTDISDSPDVASATN